MKIHWLIILSIGFFLHACHHKTNLNDLISCNQKSEFTHNKTVVDVKNNYQIKLGDTWKTELYFDNYQSRIYTADTTRSYTESFIVDITRFDGNIILSEAFTQKILSKIKTAPRTYVLKEGLIDFKGNPAYFVYSFQKTNTTVLYNLECYVAHQGYYFLLSSKINGHQKLAQNTCEVITVFNSLSEMLNNKS